MIWCVDDDNTIRNLEVYTLEQTGFQAKGFADGISMLKTLESETPELIILDIMMPVLDGLNATLRFSGRHETILWFTKGNEYTFNLDCVRIH